MNSTYNLQSTKMMTAYKILKEVSKFIVSYCVLSTFFSNPYWLPFFVQSFISHISKFPSQLLSRVDDKNCVFLVCNVIVVILAKSSTRLTSPSQPSPEVVQTVPEIPLQYTLLVKSYEGLQPMELASCASNNPELIKNVVEEEHVEEKGSFGEEEEEEEETIGDEESGSTDEDDYEDEESEESYVWVAEDEVEEESIAMISTEELNRRCEEFIRRTKEEIMIEARQQLIMV